MADMFSVTQIPGMGTDEMPAPPLERNEKSRIVYGVADPTWDIDALPLTYTNSRWFAFCYEADEKDLKRCLPEVVTLEDDVVEFWYVEHQNTRLGPYGEFGVTVSASYNGTKFGYYPYMYLTSSAGVNAGRVLGFPKKMSFIRCLEHGGGWDDGYNESCRTVGPNRTFFSFLMSRNGYLIHTATGKYTGTSMSDLSRIPMFYGKEDWGRGNLKIVSDGDLQTTRWQLTHLPSKIEGKHRFQVKPDTISTAQPEDINWFMQATPFDNMGHMLPAKKLIGLVSYNFDLIIPPAEILWTKTVTRTPEEITKYCMNETPYRFGMRHTFPKPYGI
ncbi:MAG TPA: acetoacetate decarboxylase family protein [Desulfobacteria bacterium]|nr:acetoacetate decarboxylase family protein [Desulfobacteria bacterium]